MSSPTASVVAPTNAVLIGAGQRGVVYSNYALDHPELLTIVAVAEPHQGRRDAIKSRFNLRDEVCYSDWKSLLANNSLPKGTVALIATPDAQHHAPAVAFAEAGFHILLEKPMAVQEGECEAIAATALKNDTIFAVCHVLRYTPVNLKIRQLIANGSIGDLINIQHLEPVGYAHFAHSYVRGNWHNEAKSTFSLMAKSCHDLDLIQYWSEAQGPNKVKTISSFGSLQHFKPSNKPAGAGARCFECPAAIEQACVYSAKKIYLNPLQATEDKPYKGWKPTYIALVDAQVPDIENVTAALKTGPYGECVYSGHNDVMDQQVVNLQFENGQTSSFSMIAFSEKICRRQTTIFGTRGQITCDGFKVNHFSFETNSNTIYDPSNEAEFGQAKVGRLTGHEGADYYLMSSFIRAVRTGDRTQLSSGATASLISHKIVFAAEKARKEGKVVTLDV